MSVHELEEHEGVYVRDLRRALQLHDVSHISQYPAPVARDIRGSTKERLLSSSNAYTTEAHRILDTLKGIDGDACALLGVKQSAFNNFSFRLLQSEHSADVPDDGIENFIALSYTWHSPQWTPHSAIASHHQDADGPLTPAM